MRATATDLVVWQDDEGEPAPVALRNPDTGEVVDVTDTAAVAGWVVALREWQDAVLGEAMRIGADVLNAHLDFIGRASVQVDAPDGHVYEVAGETASAAANAASVAHPAELRDDLDVLVARGLLSSEAADAACRVETTTTIKPNLARLRTLAARADAVGDAVRHHLTPNPRPRRRPAVKRLR